MARKKKNKVVDLDQVRSGLGAVTEILDQALRGSTEAEITHPALDTIEKKNDDGSVVRIQVQNRDPYSYKKRVREFLRERGEPIPDHLWDDGDEEPGK